MAKKRSKEANSLQEQRCGWLNEDPIYIQYHDNEWGKPEYNSKKLFEMICLEGQQAGLSWITVLKKRGRYRELFHNFDPHKISIFTNTDIEKICTDSGIIRHKLKIGAIVNNAKCYIKMEKEGEDFSKFIWGFVDNKPIVNNWKVHTNIPAKTPISDALSKALKQKGFKFIGSTICYAFMQACGLVDDHINDCICRKSNKKKKS